MEVSRWERRLLMSGAFLSFVGGWWARLFGRVASPRVPVTSLGAAAPEPVAVVDSTANPVPELSPAPAEPDETEVDSAEVREDAGRSLIETLGLEGLPAVVVRTGGTDPKVRERTMAALHDLRQIPALQSLAQGFLQALGRPDVEVSEVVDAIAKDSALCVRVLRMANSVLVSPERRIEDLDTAVHMLGVVRVRKTAQALFTLRDANRVAEGFDWRHLWMHALGTAAIAEELEKQLRATGDSQLHLAALLHDVGKIVLSTIAPDDYRDILVLAWNENGRLEDMERERLGVDHREAGVLFAQHNGLPAVVVEAIAHHDRPEAAEKHRFEVALVSIANYVSKAHGLGFSGARLDEHDGEFEDLPAWHVIAKEIGGRPNIEAIEAEMRTMVTSVRADLRELHEAV